LRFIIKALAVDQVFVPVDYLSITSLPFTNSPTDIMILKIYAALSALVFLLFIGPLLKDPSGARNRVGIWLFLLLAMALSPVTLPNMLWYRLLKQSDSELRDERLNNVPA
jgi:hypothetical protein